jgi:sulfur carrier protein
MRLTIETRPKKVIAILINGETRQLDNSISVFTLLERLQLAGQRIALEHNGVIVPRSQFNQQLLSDGDQLEIVVAVGGG